LGIFLVLAGAALAFWLVPGSSSSQTESLEPGLQELVVDVVGSVTLTAGDRTELVVEKEWLFGGEPDVVAVVQDGVARVSADCAWYQARCVTSVTGTVASGTRVTITTAAGSIDVSGVSNGVDLETAAGTITVTGISGMARLQTSAGNVSGDITDGDVDVKTSFGGIDLTVLGSFDSIVAETSAGNIDLTVADEVYAVTADTSAGSVTVDVATDPGSEREIIADSSAGSITIRPAP
jgi:hypothetical protein